MLTWELLGAIVGAGLASGREIASFFGRYGAWGFAGVALAGGALYLLGNARMPGSWVGRWPERLWQVLLTLLLVTTGGAMLAGAGAVAALTLPVHGAYWLGMAGTLALAWGLAQRTVLGLAWVSRAMLLVLAAMIGLGLTLPPMKAVTLTHASPLEAIARGVAYGGFNAALMHSVLKAAKPAQRQRGLLAACLLTAGILAAGNAVCLRHPALLGEEMPFVLLMNRAGAIGFWLAAAALYLAVLSTLTVCIRSTGGKALPTAAIILTAMMGFSGVVDAAYPVLGGACAATLLAMRLSRSS